VKSKRCLNRASHGVLLVPKHLPVVMSEESQRRSTKVEIKKLISKSNQMRSNMKKNDRKKKKDSDLANLIYNALTIKSSKQQPEIQPLP